MKNLRTGTAKFDTIRAKDANGLSIQDDGGNGLFIKDGGNVGIGTTDPDAGLHVVGDFGDPSTSNLITRLSQSSGNGVCDIGFMAVGATSGGNWFQSRDSSDSSKYALLFNPEGGNVGIGTTNPLSKLQIDGGNTSNSTYAFSATGASDATSKPSVQMCYDNGSTSYTMVLSKGFRSSGYILGASNSSNALCFQMLDSGDMETVLGNQIGTISDIRTKDSVVDATPKLSDIMKLRVVNFTRKDDPDKTKLIGFVAQEVEEVFPRFVASRDNREYDEDGNVISGFEDVKSVKFDSGFAILTKAIQEQQSIIEQLQSQNASLESRISALES